MSQTQTDRGSGGSESTPLPRSFSRRNILLDQKWKSFRYYHVHVCELLETTEDLLPCPAPFAPFCEKFKYGILKWLMVSSRNRLTSKFFRSKAALCREKRRQITSNFPYIIHPFCRLNVVRESILSLTYMIIYIISPLQLSYDTDYINDGKKRTNYLYGILFLNIILTINIILNFYSGFTKDNGRIMVLDVREIQRRYLRTYFVIDLVPTLYDNLVFVCWAFEFHQIYPVLLLCPLSILRFLRFNYVIMYTRHMFKSLSFHGVTVLTAVAVLLTLGIIHWFACILFYGSIVRYYLNRTFEGSFIMSKVLGTEYPIMNIYTECLLITTMHFLGTGVASCQKPNTYEKFVLSFVCMFGMCYIICLAGYGLQVYSNVNISELKFEQLIEEVSSYMTQKNLPKPLRERIRTFYNYKFQKHYFNENAINATLSEHLRCEVQLYTCKKFIDNVSLFQNAPKSLIGAFLSMVQTEIFIKDDLVNENHMAQNLYFVGTGTLACYLPDEREICHFEDGNNFGEMRVFSMDHPDVGRLPIRAVETSTVFYLDKNQLDYLFVQYPDILKKLSQRADQQWRLLSLITDDDNAKKQGVVTTNKFEDILSELRAGRILNKSRVREDRINLYTIFQ